MTTQHEFLNEAEIEAVQAHFSPTPTETGRTETGAEYVVAMGTDEDGEIETRTVCRERGQYAVLDTVGRPVAVGESLREVLAVA